MPNSQVVLLMDSEGLGNEGLALLSLKLSEVFRKGKLFQPVSTAWMLQFGPSRLFAYGLWANVIAWSVRENTAMLWWSVCTVPHVFNTGTLWFPGHAAWKASQKPSHGHQTCWKKTLYIPFWHLQDSGHQILFYSSLSGSSLLCMLHVYLTPERRAGICHLVLLHFHSCSANKSVQAINIHFCCCYWKIQTWHEI